MTQRRFFKLTVITASVILTIAAMATYRGGFAQSAAGNPQQVNVEDTTRAVDSVALAKGLLELQRIIDHYNTQSLAVNGEIRYYNADSSAAIPAEKAMFSFALFGDNSLYELDSVLTVTTAAMGLIIDKREESIAVIDKSNFEVESPEAVQAAPEMLGSMKEFIKDASISSQGQYNVLKLHFTEDVPSNITEYMIVYDPQTYAIKKLRMTMTDAEVVNGLPDEGQKAEVTEDDELYFVDSSKNAIPTGMYAKANMAVYEIIYTQEKKLQDNAIDISQYVKKDNDEYVPVGKYKNYSILN